MDIKFLGATETVTGSKHLLMGHENNILVDCGMYQGPNAEKHNKGIEELLTGEKINAIVLTHAHLDHCGYIPKFYKDGFRGPIFCTPATFDLAKIIMSDNAHVQSSEAKKHNKNIKKQSLKLTPFYTQIEVEQALAIFQVKEFGEEFKWNEFTINFKKAGHILGASSPIISNSEKRVQFSGDLGRDDDLVTLAPAQAVKVDALVIESTYGDRLHLAENLSEKFKKIFSDTKKKQSAVIIPAFSVGRSQTMMKILYQFFKNNPELNIPVFVDSPMTQAVTELYYKYPNEHKMSETLLNKIKSLFHFIQYKSEKDKLDKMDTAHIILTAGGMMTGGNILHHLRIKGDNENNYLFIVGFQSPNTIGYELLQGNMTHTFENKSTTIKAKIIEIKTLSSHADHDGLLKWAKDCEAKKIFITHGEESAKNKLEIDLKKQTQAEVITPRLTERYTL